MQNDIKIGMQVSSNGTTDAEIKKAENLKRAYNEASQSAARLGGTAGSRAAAARAGGGSAGLMSGTEYGQARGAAGTTGASARDFANQAQGLGGLVRLYATFAANIFAVSAAFTALKNAADVENLTKGLNTLGAQSGQALGTLSKRLVEVTDGAISARDAMAAVAQTSSAGMSAKNIERLALVAKNASLALGVAMPDALNRLSRGIVKLEPELLDELGLFTKIGPATEKYALELGRSATSLTDFERRQAFANAVLEEGEKKFQALNEAAANPYDKLLASLKNVATGGLNVINVALLPIVELLSKSPTALLTGLVGIAGVLIKQALPAIGEFKAGLQRTAESALQAAQGKAGDAVAAREQLNKLIEQRVESSADAQLKTFEKLEKQLYATAAAGQTRRTALWRTLKKDIVDISEADIAASEKSVKTLETNAKKDPRLEQQAKLERATLNQLKVVIDKEDELVRIKQKNREQIEENFKATGQYARVQKAAADFELKARRDSIVANAAYNSSLIGITGSWQLAQSQIKATNLQLGFVSGSLLQIRVATATLVGLFATLGGIINKAFAVIGTIAAVFSVLDGILSSNSKEAQKFSTAVDAANESIANASRTLDAARDKDGFGTRTLQNTIAISTAFSELTDSAKEAIKTAEEANRKASGWDKFWDGLFGLVGMSRADKLSKAVAGQISEAFELLSREGLQAEFQQEVQKILKIETSLKDVDAIAKAFRQLGKEQQAALGSVLERSKNNLGNISLILDGFKNSVDAAGKSYKEYIQSLADNSPLLKLGQSLQEVGLRITQLSTEGVDRLAQAFEYLATNPAAAATFFTEKLTQQFAETRKEFSEQKRMVDATKIALQQYSQELTKSARKGAERTVVTADRPASAMARGMQSELERTQASGVQQYLATAEDLNEKIRITGRTLAAQQTAAIEKGAKLIQDVGQAVFQKGSELIAKALSDARQQAELVVQKTLIAGLTGEERAKEEARIQLKQIDIQLQTLETNIELARSQASLTDAMTVSNLLQQETNAILKRQSLDPTKDAKDIAKVDDELKTIRRDLALERAISTRDYSELETSQQQLAAKLAASRRDQLTAGLNIQKARLEGERQAAVISGQRAVSVGREQDTQKVQQLADRQLQTDKSRLDIFSSIAGISSQQAVLDKIILDTTELETKQRLEILAINTELERLEYERTRATGETEAALAAQITKLTGIRTQTEAVQKAESSLKALQDRQKILAAELQTISRTAELTVARRGLEEARAQSALEYRSQEIQLYNDLFDVSNRVNIISQNSLEVERARLENQRNINAANDTFSKVSQEIAEKQKAISDTSSSDYKALTAELDRQNQLRQIAIDRSNLELNSKISLLNVTREIKLEQERYNEALQLSSNIAESLKSAFGDIGQKLASFGESLVQVGIQNEKNARALERNLKRQQEIYESGDSPAAEIIKEELELRKKSQRDELAGNARLIGSAKSLFKEKTGAYKALAAIEKALHIQRIAMDLKELATKLFTTKAETAAVVAKVPVEVAAENAGLAARIPTMITGIFGKITSQLGWFGPAIAAGIVASIFGRSMSGGSVPKGFTAQEQQEVQGTGRQFVGGQLVDRQGGVLGDNKALADSITSSLDKLSEEFFGSLGSGSSKIVQALESIKKNTGETVKALLGTVSGFGMPGSAFGTVESSSKKLGGLWGSASTSIADAGVRITGTLEGLGRAIGQFEQYENVVRTSSSWFGLVKSTSTETNVKAFEESTTKLFANIFKSVQTVLLESAVALEGPTSTAAEAIKNIPVQLNVSLKGLTGEQAVEAVLAELSVQLNRGAQLIFPYVAQYQRIGEELYETVARIVKDGETLQTGLERVGIAIRGLGTQARIALEQQLIEQLGGVDKAVSSINFYYENFLTNEERFRIQFNQLTKTFRDAGKTLPQTKQQFISLLSGLDIVNNLEDQKTFALLINNAEKYNELLDLQGQIIGDTQQKFKDFAKSLLNFKDSLLLGSATILTPIERYAKAKTEFETVRAKALAGDQESLGKLQEASQTFLTVSRELYASGEQYTTDFNSVLQALDSAAGYAQQQADVGQMQLDALNTQIGVLQNIERILTLQESRSATTPTTPTREEALSVIDTTLTTLTTLTTATNTLYDFMIEKFGETMERASGGYASGMTLVGERGPEYVDFNNPGMVYTAEQTRGMFAPTIMGTAQTFREMVGELQDLREEVTQLRKEQQRQTGDMIMTNYDAQQKVAEEIVEAVMTSVREKSWQDKSKPTIS